VRRSKGLQVTRWALAFAALLVFLATSFRAGWIRSTTDFPNYYTAAVLVAKHAPLRDYYDWPWFQRQINYAGVENQLGGYIPQTPLTMLPIVPLAGLKPQTAKRVWLLVNLALLIAIIYLLSRVTRLRVPEISLLAFAGFGTLHSNFLLGQYYVFLLFLLTGAYYLLSRQRPFSAGMLLGLLFLLKLYGAPFLLYFAVKRRWSTLSGMLSVAVAGTAAAVLLFGWNDLAYFALHILPRAAQGATLDPYNSGNGTITTQLRRAFLPEPELNPHPLWNAPWLFFFLQPFVTLLILLIPLLLLGRSNSPKRDFAWFCIALLLVSPNTASYTFVLLLLPVALLLDEAGRIEGAVLLSCYVLLCWPMHPVWLLLALLILVGRHYTEFFSRKELTVAVTAAMLLAVAIAWRDQNAYRLEPGRRWERVAVQRGAIYSSWPAVLRCGIVYESIGRGHYVLRWAHDGKKEEFVFPGEAFHPVAESADGPIRFELVAHGTSKSILLDLFTKKLTPWAGATSARSQTVSPDGRWIAYTKTNAGSEQLWLRSAKGGQAILLAGGTCNSFAPAWELDSQSLIFASDCDRGIGLPALYRARLDHRS
jgi:hypothetical protein